MTGTRFTAGGLALIAAVALLAGCQVDEVTYDAQGAIRQARAVLWQARSDENPYNRRHALEGLSTAYGRQAGAAIQEALDDEAPTVRFTAAMLLGDLQFAPARQRLAAMAGRGEGMEPDKRVLAAVVYALHRLGDDTYTRELGSLLFDEEPEVRSNAALAMGKMGLSSAVQPLRILENDERLRDERVRLNALEALTRLGDERSGAFLEAYSKYHALDFRLVAIQALGEARWERSQQALTDLLGDDLPHVRVAAAWSLARLGIVSDRSYRIAVEAAREPEKQLARVYREEDQVTIPMVASLRELSARALGQMQRPQAVAVLEPMLADPAGGVRVAAAMGILRLLRHHPVEPAELPAPAEAVETMQPPLQAEETDAQEQALP